VRRPASAALLAALVLAGCGGGDKSPSVASQAPAATSAATTAAAAAATTTAAASAPTAATTPAAAAATPAGAAASPVPTPIKTPSLQYTDPTCKRLTLVPGELSRAFNGMPNADMAGVQSDLDALRRDAPKAIRHEISTLDRAYRALAAGLHGQTDGAADGGAAAIARVQKVVATLDTNAISLATTNVSVWLQKHCMS